MNTKEAVFDILSSEIGKTVSGEELAAQLGVSRASIWKAVKALKNDGHIIDARQNAGYALRAGNVLSQKLIGNHLNNPELAKIIEIYPSVTSTNNVAKQYAAENGCGSPIEKIFIANYQTAGRGRRGRNFYSPEGSGIYMSFLLCPKVSAFEAVRFTTVASVAVCMAIEKSFGLKPGIKWVNDVFLGGRKICGILTEAVTDFETGDVDSIVIGIGVNTSAVELPEELKSIVGFLSDEELDRNKLIAEIINCLTELIEVTDSRIEIKDYIGEYKKRSMVLGKTIKILNTDETAEALDIDEKGGLIVRTDSGIKTLESGEISIRLAE